MSAVLRAFATAVAATALLATAWLAAWTTPSPYYVPLPKGDVAGFLVAGHKTNLKNVFGERERTVFRIRAYYPAKDDGVSAAWRRFVHDPAEAEYFWRVLLKAKQGTAPWPHEFCGCPDPRLTPGMAYVLESVTVLAEPRPKVAGVTFMTTPGTGTPYTVPADFGQPAFLDAVGSGGGAVTYGGGGGGFARKNGPVPTGTAAYDLDNTTDGGTTAFYSNYPSSTTVQVTGGTAGTIGAIGTGGNGQAGDVLSTGGDGAAPVAAVGGGGGGAAGPNGNGATASGANGGTGDNTHGGAGGTGGNPGTDGANGTEYTSDPGGVTAGPGGGGGAGNAIGASGGSGGLYGGGVGGRGAGAGSPGTTRGVAIIVMIYTPTAPTAKPFFFLPAVVP